MCAGCMGCSMVRSASRPACDEVLAMILAMVALLASLVLKSKSGSGETGCRVFCGAVAGDGTLYGDGGGRAVFFSAS